MKLNRGHKGLLLIAAAILASAVFLIVPRRSHFPELPNPNGYDVLVREAARITRDTSILKEMTLEQIAALVATNEPIVREIRKALSLPSVVPVQMNEQWISSLSRILPNLKAAAQAMDAEAKLGWQKRDYTNSLALCLDQVRFSHATVRGGVLINYMVGSACETIAVRRMTNLLSELNPEQCKQAARFLEEIDSQRDSFEEITARELEWQRRTFSLWNRLQAGFEKHVMRRNDPFAAMAEALTGDLEKTYNSRTLEVRRLQLKLAARAYELETGSRPSELSKLIPSYLKETPRDPATGSTLDLP